MPVMLHELCKEGVDWDKTFNGTLRSIVWKHFACLVFVDLPTALAGAMLLCCPWRWVPLINNLYNHSKEETGWYWSIIWMQVWGRPRTRVQCFCVITRVSFDTGVPQFACGGRWMQWLLALVDIFIMLPCLIIITVAMFRLVGHFYTLPSPMTFERITNRNPRTPFSPAQPKLFREMVLSYRWQRDGSYIPVILEQWLETMVDLVRAAACLYVLSSSPSASTWSTHFFVVPRRALGATRRLCEGHVHHRGTTRLRDGVALAVDDLRHPQGPQALPFSSVGHRAPGPAMRHVPTPTCPHYADRPPAQIFGRSC